MPTRKFLSSHNGEVEWTTYIIHRYHVRSLNHPTAKFPHVAAAKGLRGMGGLRVRAVLAAVVRRLVEQSEEGMCFR